jgi:hypothetical protein
MSLLHEALRAGHAKAVQPHQRARHVLVVGAAGALGAAVLEQLLAARQFASVSVLVTQRLSTAMRGLVAVPEDDLMRPAPGPHDTAVVVFDRPRHANGRELAFARPEPAGLVPLATRLHARGVRALVVVMPHASATLPEALKRGLADLDEHAVAGLGFEHLVFMRPAQAREAARAGRRLQRVADWVLSQLHLMIPQRERPVRALKVAQFAVALAAQLPQAHPGTRVVPPELVWLAAQVDDVERLAHDWLHGRPLPEGRVARVRM